MKIFIIFILLLFILSTNLLAQTEYANVVPISAQASYNDFADINVIVTASAGYIYFCSAVEYVDRWSGSNWTNKVQKDYYSHYPYSGWHTWSISGENIQITDIAQYGNGTYKYRFNVTVNSDDDEKYVTFSVTDVVAPSTPATLTGASENQHPKIIWTANTEEDLSYYEVWKKKNSGSWSLKATTTNTYYTDTGETIGSNDYVYYKIRAADENDNKSAFTHYVLFPVMAKKAKEEGIVQITNIPDSFQMSQNYPNPFNPSTIIRFGLPNAENVLLQVYNVNGQLVSTLVDGYLDAGYHDIDFNGRQLSSGIYLYKLTTNNYTIMKRMLLVK